MCEGHAWGTCLESMCGCWDMRGGHAWKACVGDVLGDHFSSELCPHRRCGGLTPGSKRHTHFIKTLNERLNVSVVMSVEI